MKNVMVFMRVSMALALVLSLAQICAAQAAGGQTGGGQTPATGNTGGGGGGRQPATQPTTPDRNQPTTATEVPRQIFLSGSVRLSDGTPPPAPVVIERVCGGVVRPEAYTDSKGHFSFIVGGSSAAAIADASVAGDPSSMRLGGAPSQSGFNASGLTGCEIRGNLAGFLSDSIILGFRGVLDDPQIGIIHMRRLGNVEGYTFSITTALAPKDAVKAYERGASNLKKQKWQDAERDLATAVQVYPKYAVAWYDLGRAYQQQKKNSEAKHAYEQAISIDPKYINPYGQLAFLSAMDKEWDDVLQYTSQMVRLNPFVSPEIYFYSAVANYNLHHFDTAESRAREAAKLDPQHKIPRINHLLGLILAEKQEYKDAAENMRTYLKFSPNAADTADIQKILADFEKAGAENPKP